MTTGLALPAGAGENLICGAAGQPPFSKHGILRGKAVAEYTERMAEERKLADRERSLQRRERELREDLNRRRNEELQSILMRSNEIIRDIARKGKYDLIVQEAVYVGPNVDITDQVIKALGK